MAIQRNKLVNNSPTWDEKKRYKVNETTVFDNVVYQNVTGFNSLPTLLNDWQIIKRKTFDNYVLVSSLNDLPTPVLGVINLDDNYTYLFLNDLDLEGNRIQCALNTPILGASSENTRLYSTGLSSSLALISSVYSLPIRNISFEHAFVFDLQGDGVTTAIDWVAVNVYNADDIGYIKNYTNVIVKDSAFINSGGLAFDGTIGTVGFDGILLSTSSTATYGFNLLSTLEITRRFRVIYSAIVSATGSIAINVDNSAIVPIEGYILDTVNFAGPGTYLGGVDNLSNKSLFVNNKGIPNTRVISNITMNGNATDTTISLVSTPVKVAGVTVNNPISEKFDNSVSNRCTYTGAITRLLTVKTVMSVISGNNHQIGSYIGKNGVPIVISKGSGTTTGSGRAENIVCQTLIEFNDGDYVEMFVENATSATNVTVAELNMIIS